MGSLFVLRKPFGFAVTICTLIFSVFAHASPSHDWLLSQQSAGGAFENSAPIFNAIQSTHEVLTTLTLESISSPVKIPLALDYLSTADTSNTEVLARVITAQAASGNSAQPRILELSARQNIDGGFGAYLHYESDPLSTAFALRALNAAASNGPQIADVVGYLLDTQLSDGGWTLDGTPGIALTAEVVLSLANQTQYQGVSTALALARVYLTNQKKGDHSWGQTFESALAISALATGANTSSELSSSVQVIANRINNNNWHGDVYTTALVLQAFKRVNSIGNAVSGKGSIKGQVILVGSTQPIFGASVSVQNTNLQTITDANGQFNLVNVPEGGQTLIIGKSGFSSTSAVASVKNALVTDVGQVVLGQAQSSGMVAGKVFASGSLQAITGATIALSGPKQTNISSNAAGQFELLSLPNGNYNFTIESVGYHNVSGSFSLMSGQSVQINQALVSLDLPLVSDPASLFGKVIDGATGSPVANAQVHIDGVATTAISSGEFVSQSVARGGHVIQIAAPGYISARYDIIFPAGAVGALGNLSLYKVTESKLPTKLNLLTTTVNSVSGAPVAGAVIKLLSNGTLVTTDANGKATLTALTNLSFNIEITAVGYVSQQLMVTAASFGSVAGTFKLVPEPPEADSWSLTGVLRDEASQSPIAGAILSLDNGTYTALTNSDGQYEFSTISYPEFELDLSANGYLPTKRLLTLGSTKGVYIVDLALTAADVTANLSVISVVAPSSVQPDSSVMINVEVENRDAVAESATIIIKLVNQHGEVVDSLLPYFPDTEVLTPHIDFNPKNRLTLQVPWDVKQTEAGDYLLRVEIVETGSISRELPRGKVIASGISDISVEGVSAFGGALDVNPPLLQAGASTPIKLNMLLRNNGNQQLEAGQYELNITNAETGDLYHTVSANSPALFVNEVAELDFGSWVPLETQLGDMEISVARLDDVKGEISGSIYIGDVAKAEFTIDRATLPEGDSSLKGTLRLSGVDTKLGKSVDPLFALVQSSLKSGSTYTTGEAINWDKNNRCVGCHIQAQAVASLGGIAASELQDGSLSYLVNTIATSQYPDGSVTSSSYKNTPTLFSMWGFSEVDDLPEAYRTKVNAAKFLWNKKIQSAELMYWAPDHNSGWLTGRFSATALAALTIANLMEDKRTLKKSVRDYAWSQPISLFSGTSGESALKSVGDYIYVANAYGRLEMINTLTGEAHLKFNSVAGAVGEINGLEYDNKKNFWMSTQNGSVIEIEDSGRVVSSRKVCTLAAGGLAFDLSFKNLYVTCVKENQLKKIDLLTNQIETISSGGLLNGPFGLLYDSNDSLLIANQNGYNLLKVNMRTAAIDVLVDGINGKPINLAKDSQGYIYVTSLSRNSGPQGIDKIYPNGFAERILWENSSYGIVNHASKIYISDNTRNNANKLFSIEEFDFDDSILDEYVASVPLIANLYLLNFNSLTQNNIEQAASLIGLSELRKILPSGILREQVDAKIVSIANTLKMRQAPGGGWTTTGGATNENRDPLMTALVGIALEYTSPSSQDPMVRNAITYLLNTQKANGAWHTNTNIFTTDLGTTSLVMVYMPKALNRLGGLDVKLTLEQSENVLLSNPSIPPSATTPLANGSFEYLWDLKGVTGNGRELTFDLTIKELGLKEERSVSTHAQIAFANSFTEEVIVKPVDIPSVVAVTAQTLGLQTNKSVYAANELVQIGSLVKNLGSAFSGGNLQLSIRSVDGNSVIAELAPIDVGALATLESQSTASDWNTVITLAGAYEIYGQLIDSRNHVVAEDIASIAITATPLDGSALVGASLFTDKVEYRLTETVKLDATASNNARNAILTPSLGKLRVVDSFARVVLERDFAIPQLVTSEQFARQTALELVGVDAGNYQASWNIYDAAGVNLLVSASTAFAVIDDPLRSLLGNVTVEHLELERGAVQRCDFVVINRGTTLLNDISLKKSVVSIESEMVKEESDESLSLVASGSHSYNQLFATTDFEKGDYACVLEATFAGQTAVLATGLFSVSVNETPIKLTGDLVLGEKARLLVLIDSSTTERTYLENLLTNAGWFYTIVDNAAAFKTELTHGGYGVYALLSEKVTLDQATQNLLKTNVAAGDGLIVAGATDRRHQSLEQALGINARTNEAYAKGINLQESTLGYAWERAFNKSSRVLNFTANGATVIGEYRNDLPGADTQTVLGALGGAGRYASFVLDNLTSLSSTIEGRMAVGGNLNLQHFSVGDKLDPNKLHDVVTVGGDVTFPSGRIYYGNLIAGGSVSGVGDPVRFGMAQGAIIRGNSAVDINFAGEREYLQELSATLATLPANGTVKMQWGGMELKGDCTKPLQVFTVNAQELASAHTFVTSCIPTGATVIFNVIGETVALRNLSMYTLTAIREKVLFNFPQAKTVKLTSIAIEGSILAPWAAFEQPAGRIEGQVIGKSWLSTLTGYLSIHNRVFNGDLSSVASPTSKNALATYQYQQGKSVFAGFDVLAQAVALGVSSENPFAQLLLSALEQVNPAPITARAGKVVPVVLTYENTGAQTATGQVKLALTGITTLLNPAGFTPVANSNDWVLPLSLNAGVSNSQTVYVQLPASGASSIRLQLQTGTQPDWATRFEKALNFNLQ